MEKWLNVNVIGYSGIREVSVWEPFIQETVLYILYNVLYYELYILQ
jgi:hypothetical protein